MNLLEKLKDLLVQAETEHSHAYTASVLRETIKFIEEEDTRKEAVALLGGLTVMKSPYVKKGVCLVSTDDFPST